MTITRYILISCFVILPSVLLMPSPTYLVAEANSMDAYKGELFSLSSALNEATCIEKDAWFRGPYNDKYLLEEVPCITLQQNQVYEVSVRFPTSDRWHAVISKWIPSPRLRTGGYWGHHSVYLNPGKMRGQFNTSALGPTAKTIVTVWQSNGPLLMKGTTAPVRLRFLRMMESAGSAGNRKIKHITLEFEREGQIATVTFSRPA